MQPFFESGAGVELEVEAATPALLQELKTHMIKMAKREYGKVYSEYVLTKSCFIY